MHVPESDQSGQYEQSYLGPCWASQLAKELLILVSLYFCTHVHRSLGVLVRSESAIHPLLHVKLCIRKLGKIHIPDSLILRFKPDK